MSTTGGRYFRLQSQVSLVRSSVMWFVCNPLYVRKDYVLCKLYIFLFRFRTPFWGTTSRSTLEFDSPNWFVLDHSHLQTSNGIGKIVLHHIYFFYQGPVSYWRSVKY